MTQFSIQDLINKAVMPEEEHPKNSWWSTDLGKCLTGAYYRRMGLKPTTPLTEKEYRRFKTGNLFEDFVIEQIRKTGAEFETQVPIYVPEWDLGGRIDLKINGLIYEIKSVHSQKFWKKDLPDFHHKLQLWTYLYATQTPEGRLIYLSKDDLTILEFPIFLDDPQLKEEVEKEVDILKTAWETKTPPLPPPTIIDGKINWQALYCPYHDLCLGNKNWLKEAQKEIKVKRSVK